MKFQQRINSVAGALYLVATAKGLTGIFWTKQAVPLLSSGKEPFHSVIFLETINQLNEYFSGDRREFELPLDPQGSAFQKKVWGALQDIPYGETRSYRDIASAVGDPNASRAVGLANGKNPLSIVIPCHRVILSSGEIGDYAGGREAKRMLLNIEQGQTQFPIESAPWPTSDR